MAAIGMRILTDRGTDPPQQALRELNAPLLGLGTLIAASLPYAESFDDTMSKDACPNGIGAPRRHVAHQLPIDQLMARATSTIPGSRGYGWATTVSPPLVVSVTLRTTSIGFGNQTGSTEQPANEAMRR